MLDLNPLAEGKEVLDQTADGGVFRMGKRTAGGRKLPAKRENSPGPEVQRKSGSISESISGERRRPD